jgi:hypothetical protein
MTDAEKFVILKAALTEILCIGADLTAMTDAKRLDKCMRVAFKALVDVKVGG